MTPAELIDEMNRFGFSMSQRKLSDWLGKGLLPKLVRHGRGRGLGTKFEWVDPDVLEQAILVHQLLDRHSRTESALIGLWLAGYSIPADRAKRAWISLREKRAKATRRGAEKKGGDFENFIAYWIERFGTGGPEEIVRDILAMILNVTFNPDYQFDEDDAVMLFTELAGESIEDKTESEFETDTDNATSVYLLISEILAYSNSQKTLELASLAQLDHAHRNLKPIRICVEKLFNSSQNQYSFPNIHLIDIMELISPIVVYFHLFFQNYGISHYLDDSIVALTKFGSTGIHRKPNGQFGYSDEALIEFRSRIKDIWADLEVEILSEAVFPDGEAEP